MRSRLATALAGLLCSLALSVAIYHYTGWLVGFLVVPFVPFLLRGGERPPRRTCPACGYETRDPETRYCPRDGTELDR